MLVLIVSHFWHTMNTAFLLFFIGGFMKMVDADALVIKTGKEHGNLWTGSDFRTIGINEPALAFEFLKTYGVESGCLLWTHKDDDVSKSVGKGKAALALYKFPST
jgi:hypothetical protein